MTAEDSTPGKPRKVLVIGSGPIVIGQAAEFDYAGTQACRALREEGVTTVLVNSNPATIMTDEDIADSVYIEPLTVEVVERIIQRERPDGVLPTLGGQTGLNLAVELADAGIFEKYDVRLLGTPLETIKDAEDRERFRSLLAAIGEPTPPSEIVGSLEESRIAAEKLGLPCGGHLDIVIEPVEPDPARRSHFEHLVARLDARACVERSLDVRSGAYAARDVARHQPLHYDHDAGRLVQTYGPQYQLFIIGTNMVASYVAEIALALDYDVVVCDPRADELARFTVTGVRKVRDMPDDAVRRYADDPYSAIVALTHDPRIDDMGLMEALKTDAFYVGAMGSARTSANRRIRLEALELTDAEIDRLHAPVGLPIGSKTPPEIAVAVLAEITAVRQRKADAAHAALQASTTVAPALAAGS